MALRHTLSFKLIHSPTHTHKSKVQTETVQAAFPFSNYILHLNASNAFPLQTAELINSHLLLLDSPRGGKNTTAPYYDSLIPTTSTDDCRCEHGSLCYVSAPLKLTEAAMWKD